MRGKFSRGISARPSDGWLCGNFQSFAASARNLPASAASATCRVEGKWNFAAIAALVSWLANSRHWVLVFSPDVHERTRGQMPYLSDELRVRYWETISVK